QNSDNRPFIVRTVAHDVAQGVDPANTDLIRRIAKHFDGLGVTISDLTSLIQINCLCTHASGLISVLTRVDLCVAAHPEGAGCVVKAPQATEYGEERYNSGTGVGNRFRSF